MAGTSPKKNGRQLLSSPATRATHSATQAIRGVFIIQGLPFCQQSPGFFFFLLELLVPLFISCIYTLVSRSHSLFLQASPLLTTRDFAAYVRFRNPPRPSDQPTCLPNDMSQVPSVVRRFLLESPPGEWALKQLRELLIGALKQGPIPQHVAFEMDGNRRYARNHRMETVEGHHRGFEALARVRKLPLHLRPGPPSLTCPSVGR